MVTDEEAEAFAANLEAAFVEADSAAYNGLIDWKAIADDVLAGSNMPPKDRQSFVTGMIQTLTGSDGFLDTMIRSGGDEASYRLLRLFDKEGKKHVMFRITGEMGINYHDLTLVKKNGRVKAIQIYPYLAGEQIFETMRRSALPMLQQRAKSWLLKLTTKESDYVKHFDKVQLMLEQFRSQQYVEALATYRQLPASVRKEKNILLIRYQVAANVSEKEIVDAVADYRRNHPKDVVLDFLMIDFHYLQGQYEEMLACVDRLDAAVGGDEYLNL